MSIIFCEKYPSNVLEIHLLVRGQPRVLKNVSVLRIKWLLPGQRNELEARGWRERARTKQLVHPATSLEPSNIIDLLLD